MVADVEASDLIRHSQVLRVDRQQIPGPGEVMIR
jgi:hypothetical protein